METVIAAILSGVVTLIGVLIANSRSNAVMEYKIEELTRKSASTTDLRRRSRSSRGDIQVLSHRMTDIETHEHEHERG